MTSDTIYQVHRPRETGPVYSGTDKAAALDYLKHCPHGSTLVAREAGTRRLTRVVAVRGRVKVLFPQQAG